HTEAHDTITTTVVIGCIDHQGVTNQISRFAEVKGQYALTGHSEFFSLIDGSTNVLHKNIPSKACFKHTLHFGWGFGGGCAAPKPPPFGEVWRGFRPLHTSPTVKLIVFELNHA